MNKVFMQLGSILFFALIAPQAALAKTKCTPPQEFQPPLCQLVLPPIVSVTIEENSPDPPSNPATAADCSGFVVTDRQVRRYLTRAKRVPYGADSTLDWSPCTASGSVRFEDGQSARWTLSPLRVGSVVFDKRPEWVLYCPNCTDEPFY